MDSIECHSGTCCSYLNGRDVRHLLGERQYLSQLVDEMEKVMALAEAEIEKLRRENEELRGEKEALRYDLKQILGKIFKPQVKPHEDVNRPKHGAPCGDCFAALGTATAADGPKSPRLNRGSLTSIPINATGVAVR